MSEENERRQILIVDDEPSILVSLESLFEDDFQVHTCATGAEAIEILKNSSISAILSDQRMPGMTGDEFLAEARRISEATRILITGYADLDAVVRAVNGGQIYGYVAKPWEPIQLKTLVERAVEHFELLNDLQHEKNLLSTLMDYSVDSIFIKDADRRFLRANRGMARFFKLDDPAELVGKRTEEFKTLSRELAEAVRTKDQELIDTGIPQLDEVVLGNYPDGKQIWFSISRAPILSADGKIDGLVGIVRDVTDRLKAEEDLRQSETKFRDFATTASDWFWESDERHRFTWISERFSEVTGLEIAEFLGKRRDKVGLDGVDADRLQTHQADLEAHRPFRNFIYARRRPDGRQIWFSTNGTPKFDDEGNFVGYRGTGSDVTDRKRAEEAVALVSGIALKLGEVSSIDDAFTVTLRSVCERLDWALGEAWVADESTGGVRRIKVWSKDLNLLKKFGSDSRSRAMALGEGFSGRVWDNREPIWVASVSDRTSANFARRELVLETGLISACAIPVVANDRVVAVLKFFLRHSHEDDRRWVNALAAATAPLGAFLLRIAAEDAQRESEQRFRDFAAIGTDWLWEMDANLRFSWFSEQVEEILGIPAESLLGKRREETGIEGVDEEILKAHFEDLKAHRSFRNFLHARRRKDDGRLIWISINGDPYFNADGKFLGYRGVGRDITRQIEDERAIRDREETVRLILHSAAEAIYGVDLDGNCTFCNPSTLKLLGYEREDQLLGKNMHALSHHTTPDGAPYPREDCPMSRAISAGQSAHSDNDIFWRADGTSFPAEYWSHPVIKEGKLTGAVVTFLDITERKRAEEAVRLVNQISALASRATDTVSAFTLALKSMCGHLHWTLGEAWVPEDDQLRLAACWHESDKALDRFEIESKSHSFGRGRGLPGRVWEMMKPLWIADVTTAPLSKFPRNALAAECGLSTSCAIPVVVNDEVVAVLAFFLRQAHNEDVKWLDALAAAASPLGSVLQRIVAEEQMMSLARFHSENPSPVLRISADGTLHSANAASIELLEIWGVQVGQPSPADIRSLVNDILNSNLTQQLEVEGDQKIFNLNLVPIADEGYVNVYGEDVTLQKKAEQKLRTVQKMEAIGKLTGGVAHDFNNRLTVMLGNLELLEDRVADNERALKLVKGARRAAEGGAKLTRQLLTFSRRQMLEPEVVDVNDLLNILEDMIQRTLGESIQVNVNLEEHPWLIRTDAGQLEDAILNLSVNARDAMPDGGILTIETENVDLTGGNLPGHEYMLPGEYLMIAVTDTGTGIPKAVQERIFEPFFSTKEAGKGTGLGMAMVYGFIKQSKGYVNLYSEEGHGTCVKLYLPRYERIDAGKAPEPEVATVRQNSVATVLVVEDDPGVRNVAVTLLSEFGYRVLEAENGMQALDIVGSEDGIDLLFTDMVMPGGLGGLELSKKVRSHRPDIKVVYTSGYTEKGPFNGGSDGKKVHWLTKPYTREKLAQKVREALGETEVRRGE